MEQDPNTQPPTERLMLDATPGNASTEVVTDPFMGVPELDEGFTSLNPYVALKKTYDATSPPMQRFMRHTMQDGQIGQGAEKIVFPYGDDKVVAFFHNSRRSAGEMKKLYYSGKLLHLIFPTNFPDVHTAGSQPPMLISDRVRPPSTFAKRFLAGIRRPFTKLHLAAEFHRKDIYVDSYKTNYMSDQKGRLKYVDTATVDYELVSKNRRIKKAIKRLDDPSRRRAAHYLERLK